MLPGNQRDRIEILNEVEAAKDSYSGRNKSYTHAFYDRANISWASGGEAMIGRMGTENRTFKAKVRFRIGRFNERQVIAWRSEYYNIRSIDPDRRRNYMILTIDRIPTGTIDIV
ncbi:phage head completion protein [Sunxiuqinia indica]|uniref:phage head completion protein n=1 Tax=Sunxiuqinia indica TaxID=2692584 RepID=UPI00135AEE90|nr:head-tail adaptor protein [Sunxiuqinia indica]